MKEKFNLFNRTRIDSIPNTIAAPLFFRLSSHEDRERLEELLIDHPETVTHDMISIQLQDLLRCRYPHLKSNSPEVHNAIATHLGKGTSDEYGVWVFFPWSKKLVHLLDEEEFTEVRTNRNAYKITKEEQRLLRSKKIGIIGLSVGKSIATTLVLERVCGEIRIADFDSIELSNMNRVQASVADLGINKAILTARELYELDPFMRIILFQEGVDATNIQTFFHCNGKLDLVIEECDSFDIKILIRKEAKKEAIAVLMETNDSGLVDIERYDLEPSLPILHGLLDTTDLEAIDEAKTSEDKIPFVLKVVEAQKASVRGRASLIEVGQTLTSWPQLASSVILGAGITANIARRILLNDITVSGRYYIDVDKLIPSSPKMEVPSPTYKEQATASSTLNNRSPYDLLKNQSSSLPTDKELFSIIEAANLAPSVGNDQPWRWEYFKKEGFLMLWHDTERAKSYGNFSSVGSLNALGSCFENAYLKAAEFGYHLSYQFITNDDFPDYGCALFFNQLDSSKHKAENRDLVKYISQRETNRLITKRELVSENILKSLIQITTSIPKINAYTIESTGDLEKIGHIIGQCDRLRFFHSESHHDFFEKEIRWKQEELTNLMDGIDSETLGLSRAQKSAIEIVKDFQVVDFLDNLNLGNAFTTISIKHARSASAMILLTISEFTPQAIFESGIASERLWLLATKMNVALHPLISPIFFFTRLDFGGGIGIKEKYIPDLTRARKEMYELFKVQGNEVGVFLCRIFYGPAENNPKIRREVDQTLSIRA